MYVVVIIIINHPFQYYLVKVYMCVKFNFLHRQIYLCLRAHLRCIDLT